MQRLATSMFALTLVPVAVLAAPVSTLPTAEPRPVPPVVEEHDALVDSRKSTSAAAAASEESVAEVADTGVFTTVGLLWERSEHVPRLSVRARLLAGGWGPWYDVESAHQETERPDGRVVSEPVYVGRADDVQVRIRGKRPEAMTVVTVDPGTSSADGTLGGRTPASTAHAALPRPAIITRAQWGADESLRTHNPGCDGSASYASSLRGGVLHHTAGSNSYTRAESPGIVRAAYAYHVKTNGWCDLGYNFLVDKYGQIFEGRAGGADRNVIGAHAAGFNTGTVGVSLMGNYDQTTASAAAQEGLAQVFAWRFSAARVDPRATSTFVSGGSNKYPAGQAVVLHNLFAHRDVGQTACPGLNLYPRLGALRDRIAAIMATAPTFDLWSTKVTSTGSGMVELHPLSGSDQFASFSDHIATAFGAGRPEDWRYVVAPYGGSGRPDLFGIKLRGTDSGRLEVHVLSAASGYRSFVLHRATAQPALPATQGVDVAVAPYAGDGRSNVYIIPWQSTGSGTVEVHVLAEATSFTSFLTHSPSALPTSSVRPGEWTFLVGDGAASGDLVGVWAGPGTGSGGSEVHALSRASGYRSWSRQVALPVGYAPASQYGWVMGDEDGDRVPDLLLVNMQGATSKRTEVSVLDGASGFKTRLPTRVTALEPTTRTGWQFSGR